MALCPGRKQYLLLVICSAESAPGRIGHNRASWMDLKGIRWVIADLLSVASLPLVFLLNTLVRPLILYEMHGTLQVESSL